MRVPSVRGALKTAEGLSRATRQWIEAEDRWIKWGGLPLGEYLQVGPRVLVSFGLFSLVWDVPEKKENE